MSALTPTAPSAEAATIDVVGACPHDCPDTCSLITTVQAGRATRVRGNPAHAATGGVLCTKVSRYHERTHHPDRVLAPLRRVGAKGEGRFEPIGWDEALGHIARRLGAIAARAPEAIVPYSYAGTMGLVQGESMDRRFFHALGASLLDRTICASAGAEALAHTLGGKVGMHTRFFAESRLILIWGSNSIASNLHFWRHAQAARRAGARLVCIDPRRTETADKCDEHVALMPGTDAALALGVMHELIVHDWLDHDYIARHTLGWPALRERALLWSPERAAAVCGVPAAQIRRLARDWGTTRAAAIRLNYGVQRCAGGGNAVRAICCLPALTGAWRHRAGGVLLSSSGAFPVDRAALQRPDLLAGRAPRTVNMVRIGDALAGDADALSGGPAIEALVVYNSNPVAVAPDSARVAQGFARPDLFTVVLEHFLTDTADFADIVLPATTQLEHWDIHLSYGHTDVLLNRPAIAPQGQARSNARVFRELAARMGLTHPCFADSDEALCRQAYGDAVPWQTLATQGFAALALPDAPFAEGGFPTPSGRCEFFSARLAARGQDGLPDHVPNHEAVPPPTPRAAAGQGDAQGAAGEREHKARETGGIDACADGQGAAARVAAAGAEAEAEAEAEAPGIPGDAGDAAHAPAAGRGCDRHPLAMISPPARNFLNSSFVNVVSLRSIEGEPLLEIHPLDAAARGIADGALVRVFNDRGSYHCAARISERARPGVVNGLGIWWRKLGPRGTNVNQLTSQRLTDMGRAPTFYDCRVEVEPA